MLTEKCAKAWTELKPIPEQIALVEDDCRFKVVVAGRRCLAEGTLVKTPEGSKAIEDLMIGEFIIAWEDGVEIERRVHKHYVNGEQRVTPLLYRGKRILSATSDHRLLSEKGLVHVSEINKWNKIVTNTGLIELYKEKSFIAKTYDIEVDNETNLYVLESGVITHNSGKTERAKRMMVHELLTGSNKILLLAAPTYNQVKKIFWRDMLDLIPEFAIHSVNKSELEIEMINGNTVTLIGLDKPDRIEGVKWTGGVIDEVDSIKPDAWESNIMPALGTVDVNNPDFRAWCWLIGVPEGRGLLYKTHLFGLSDDPKFADWKTYQWKSSEILSEEDLNVFKSTMDPKRYRREWEASFEDIGDIVVYAFSETENVKRCADNGGDIVVGMDFNRNPMSAVLGTIYGDSLFIWQEYERMDSNTADMMATITADYPGRNLLVYPDPTGSAHKTNAGFGVTDHSIITNDFGCTVIAPKSNKSNRDSINILNAMMEDANGRRHTFIDPRCKRLIHCLLGWQYDMGLTGNQPDKKKGLDHLPDALKYITLSAFNKLSTNSEVYISQPDIY